MKNKIKNSVYVLSVCFISIFGIVNLGAQEISDPVLDEGGCSDCHYKKKDVPCIRAGFQNGEPYAFIGDRVKCVDGVGSCNSTSCTQAVN